MSIVTKTGDTGMTSLYNGERVPKAHPRIEAVGAIDEANSILGFVNTEATELKKMLFELGSVVANPESSHSMTPRLSQIEKHIIEIENKLPPLTKFILPGGHPDACHYFHARAVCRRAERLMTQMTDLPENALAFTNRLSDYLFLLAREANLTHGAEEVLWGGKSEM